MTPEITEAERTAAHKLCIDLLGSYSSGQFNVALAALRSARAEGCAAGMERSAGICHAHNLTLEYKGQPLQDCISNRIRAAARELVKEG